MGVMILLQMKIDVVDDEPLTGHLMKIGRSRFKWWMLSDDWCILQQPLTTTLSDISSYVWVKASAKPILISK
jgi:hypothetical protein